MDLQDKINQIFSENARLKGDLLALKRMGIHQSSDTCPFYECFIPERNHIIFSTLYNQSGFEGVGSYFSINALGMIFSGFIINRLVRKCGEFTMILINTILFVGGIFLITQVSSIRLLLLAFPAGFAMGSVAPVINTYLLQTLPGNRKGLADELYFSALDIGYGIGPVLWGVIAMKLGYRQVFMLRLYCKVRRL